MKWHVVDCQRLEYLLNVDLGTAGDTKVYMWKLQVDKLLYDREDLSSCCWVPRIWALIEGIYNEIDRTLPWKSEHLLQASHKCISARLLGSTIVG